MIKENINKILSELPAGVKLVAVSKLKPVDDIMEAYNAGQRVFGENYATELRDKAAVLPKDIEWHFIGHLQGKQLKYYIPFVSMIHGVDSVEHLEEVERAAAKVGRVVDVLLQVHVAQEETKFGFAPEELESGQWLVASGQFPGAETATAQLTTDHRPLTTIHSPLSHVRIRGLMGMASHTEDEQRIRADFRTVRKIFEKLKSGQWLVASGQFPGAETATAQLTTDHRPLATFDTLSMGMSHDWRIAVEEGSTMVRLGTSIFGQRDYSKK